MTTTTYARRAHSQADPPFLDTPGRQRLCTLRARSGLDVATVAQAFGIHPARLADMEAGYELIPAFLLTGWCRFLERACDERDGWERVA